MVLKWYGSIFLVQGETLSAGDENRKSVQRPIRWRKVRVALPKGLNGNIKMRRGDDLSEKKTY